MQIINCVPWQALGREKKKGKKKEKRFIISSNLLNSASITEHREEKSESLKYFFLSVHLYHLPDPELTNVLRLMAVNTWCIFLPYFTTSDPQPSPPHFSTWEGQQFPVSSFSMVQEQTAPGAGALPGPWPCWSQLAAVSPLRGSVPPLSPTPLWFKFSQAGISAPKHWQVQLSVSLNSLQRNHVLFVWVLPVNCPS